MNLIVRGTPIVPLDLSTQILSVSLPLLNQQKAERQLSSSRPVPNSDPLHWYCPTGLSLLSAANSAVKSVDEDKVAGSVKLAKTWEFCTTNAKTASNPSKMNANRQMENIMEIERCTGLDSSDSRLFQVNDQDSEVLTVATLRIWLVF